MSPTGTPARIAIVGVCLEAHAHNALSHFIMPVPGAVAVGNLERYVGAEREVGRLLEGAYSRICIIDFDQNPDEAMWIAERLHSEYPDVYVFAASSNSQPDRIIAAMRAGCAEYLLKPLQNERVLDGIARVEAKQKERVRSKIRGRVISLIGAKGGTGVTALALHLALHLSNGTKRRCLLVDQHQALGDASLYLGTGRHQYSFFELAGNTDRLDEELLQGFLLHHQSGLDLLDSPEALDSIHAPPAAIEQTLGFLAEMYQFVVLDLPPGLTDATLAAISQSDQVAIVLTAELPAVRNAVRYIEHLAKLGYGSSAIRIVLNRHSKKGPLADDKVEKALQRPISYRIPNSYNELIRAINAGVPIGRETRSEFAQAMNAWAQEVIAAKTGAKPAAAAPARSNGMFGLFSH